MRLRINLSLNTMRDRSDWHNKFFVDQLKQFLIEHDIKKDNGILNSLVSPANIKLIATWLNSKGFDVQPWWIEIDGSIAGYGFDFDTNNEYYVEAKLKYVR